MIDMKEWLENFSLTMVLRMLFGSPFSSEIQNADQFKNAIRRFLELLGAFVPSDVIPCLKWFDLGGYEKKMKKTAKEIDVMVDKWLQVHKNKMKSTRHVDGSTDQVFMATLFSRVKEELKHDLHSFSIDAIVKSTCLAIFAAASHTTTVTLTWALALLVNNPRVLQNAQKELEKHVGRDREVEDSDLKNLVYIQAIIKETLRLYPVAPLSAPHESTEDCVVGGYTVPKLTVLLVNIWNIQHDSQMWTDPFSFEPERFLTSKKEIDVIGQHFEFLPFGSDGLIDMTEIPGFTTPKTTPLDLLVAPRLSPHLPPRYDVSDLLDTTYRTYWVRRIELLRYGVLGSLGTVYWLFGYEELAENVLLMVFDQSIIYGVSADVDTTYSSKSGNGLEFFKVLDMSYASRMVRRIDVRISRLSQTLRLCFKTRPFLHLLPNTR
ncbi:cytochrome P450 CYP82D47-like protein [Tanacetum coccineum]